jgi:acyl-CoA thioesterase FadM
VLFSQAVRNESGELLAEGRARVACVDRRSFKPRRLPAGLAERMGA